MEKDLQQNDIEIQEYTYGETDEMPETSVVEKDVKEKVALGFIGALVGSVIGAV